MRNASRTPAGSALIVTLAILVLVTVLAVGMLGIVQLERVSARNVLAAAKARSLSELGANHALAQIRDAISAAESTVTSELPDEQKLWASQPGRITVFNADGTVDEVASRPLYSTHADPAAPTVDLNAAPFGGVHPIMADDGTGSAPPMVVHWINVLADPSAGASADNPLIGRYAFWVDDDSTKLNINTADGSTKGGDASFGPGTPAEVNLQVLAKNPGTISGAEAAAIAKQSGAQYDTMTSPRPFNSSQEILQTGALPSDVFDLNYQDITAYNRSPDLNIFGEPMIHLATAIPSIPDSRPTSTPLSLLTGAYADLDPSALTQTKPAVLPSRIIATGQPLAWIYPGTGVGTGNSQLPAYHYKSYGDTVETTVRLPQFFRDDIMPYTSGYPASQGSPAKGFPARSLDYEMGMRIARYLKGWNSQGNPVNWPPFTGSGTGKFARKYTDRQIDDISLQILSLLKQTHTDHYYNYTLPYYMPTGFLSGKPVRGLSRGPRLTEIVLKVTTIAGDPPQVKVQHFVEFYLPGQFKGSDLTFGDLNTWKIWINFKDWPPYTNGSSGIPAGVTGHAPMGGYWADSMLRITDQNGELAGADLFGNPGNKADPDQAKAALYHHPWALKDPLLPHDPVNNPYMGTGFTPTYPTWGYPVFNFNKTFPGAPNDFKTWKLGDYTGASSGNAQFARPMKSGTESVTISGGLAVWLDGASAYKVEAAPIDSIFPNASTLTAAQRETLLEALIAIPGTEAERTIPIPGQKVFHMQVADPLVNSFPGDWQGTVLDSTDSPEITMPVEAMTSGPQVYQNGLNTISEAGKGADPESIWWPRQDVSIPKSRRFPSSGYLQYLRTGAMPDPANDSKPLREQKGTPWRTLNFSPSGAASQQTLGGESYPDWAMLDLFMAPAVFQPLGDPLPLPIIRTWGGATAGRINPNAVLVPFNIVRTKPLEALFKGVKVVTEYDHSGNPVESVVDEAALAGAVTAYIQARDRPLMLPGEICNIPAIAASLCESVDEESRSRNDLVRQTVGNLATRSNTFTVWTAGEVIQKKRGNTSHGTFEPGDTVIGRSRMRYVIERYLDPGTDGIYGNAIDPGPDGVVNTPDDPTTGTGGAHPTMTYPLPYKYRIISISQVE